MLFNRSELKQILVEEINELVKECLSVDTENILRYKLSYDDLLQIKTELEAAQKNAEVVRRRL